MARADLISSMEGRSIPELPQDHSDFLSAAHLIANENGNGIIDRGEEAARIGELLTGPFSSWNITSITAKDIEDYRRELCDERTALEADAWNIVLALQRDPTTKLATFGGESYHVSKDDMNTMLNERLEAVGSRFRILLMDAGERSQMMAFVFIPTSEEKTHMGRRVVRRLHLEEPLVSANTHPSFRGATDMRSMMLILDGRVRRQFADRVETPNLSTFYKPEAHLAVQNEVRSRPHGQKSLLEQRATELTDTHETSHLGWIETHGEELYVLNIILQKNGETRLNALLELDADLDVIETLAAKKDRDAFLVMSLLRGPSRSDEHPDGGPLYAEISSDLLLSAVRVDGNRMTIDWDRLKNNTKKLRALLRQAFSDIQFALRAYATGNSPDASRQSDIENQFQVILAKAITTAKKAERRTTEPTVRFRAAQKMYERATRHLAQSGYAWYAPYLDHLTTAHEGVDQMMKSLGVPADRLPFASHLVDHVVPPTP